MAMSADDLNELVDFFRILAEIEKDIASKEVLQKSIIPNIIAEGQNT